MAVHHRRYNNNNNTCIKRNQSSSFANVRQQTLMENWTTSSTLKCNWQCSSCCWEPLEKIEITTKLFIIKDHQWIELLLYSEENHQLHRKSWNVHLMALSQHNSLGRLLNRLKVTLQTLAYMLLQNPSNCASKKIIIILEWTLAYPSNPHIVAATENEPPFIWKRVVVRDQCSAAWDVNRAHKLLYTP